MAAASGGDSKADTCMQEKVCRGLVQRGAEQYQSLEFEAALDSYQAAYARFPLPPLLFNIARAQHQLGRRDAAQQNYKLVLIQSNDETLRIKAHGYLRQIEEQRPAKSTPEPTKDAAPPSPVISVAVPPPPRNQTEAPSATRLYKKWWLWTAVGAVAVAGTVGIIVGTQVDPRPVPGTLIDLRNRF